MQQEFKIAISKKKDSIIHNILTVVIVLSSISLVDLFGNNPNKLFRLLMCLIWMATILVIIWKIGKKRISIENIVLEKNSIKSEKYGEISISQIISIEPLHLGTHHVINEYVFCYKINLSNNNTILVGPNEPNYKYSDNAFKEFKEFMIALRMKYNLEFEDNYTLM